MTECGCFADDTFITFASKNITTIETVMNYEISLAMYETKQTLSN